MRLCAALSTIERLTSGITALAADGLFQPRRSSVRSASPRLCRIRYCVW